MQIVLTDPRMIVYIAFGIGIIIKVVNSNRK